MLHDGHQECFRLISDFISHVSSVLQVLDESILFLKFYLFIMILHIVLWLFGRTTSLLSTICKYTFGSVQRMPIVVQQLSRTFSSCETET